jgi:hypothetical protein
MPGGRGVNVLTSDGVADMGGGPAFHSTQVEIGRVAPKAATAGARPAVGAHGFDLGDN